MPNPVPRPMALNVYVSTPPSGFNYNIAPYIGRQAGPVIRFSADGLSSETSLPLHYTGNLPYSIQEWAEIKIEAIDNSEKLFRGYIGRLTSQRLGAQRHLNLTCVDGNIKLKRGVGRTVDGGNTGIIPTMLTFGAGTTDRAVIIALFNDYLPDVDWSLVDNVFTLTEPFQVGLCTIYDALVALRKRAPSTAKIRFYCSFRQADWAWQFRWFDVVTLPTSGITLTDDPEPGAGEASYWTWQRVRDGMPVYNRWYVVGKDPVTGGPVIGGADDTTSQNALTVIIAGISEDTTKATIAECEAEAARLLIGRRQARESFTGIETHQPLLLTGPQAIYVKNDLEPGITTPQPFPVSSAEFSFPNMIPTYRADLGDRWLALGEEDEGRLYSTPPTRDTTAPDAPTWPGGTAWIVSNVYMPHSNTTRLTIQWNSNTEGDLRRYLLHYCRFLNNEPGSPLPFSEPIYVNAPSTQYTLEFPPGVLVGFMLKAEDTGGNVSSASLVKSTTTATDPIPQPTAVTITDYGIHHAGHTATTAPSDSMYIRVDYDLGSYVPGEGASAFVMAVTGEGGSHPHRVEQWFDLDTNTPPLYLSGLRLGGYVYRVYVRIRNQYGYAGPLSAYEEFTTKRVFAPPGVMPWPSTKDDRGLIPGYDLIATGTSTSWELVEDDSDEGGNAFHAALDAALEYAVLETQPMAIVKGRPLSWAFSVRGFAAGPSAATGDFSYIIKWCSADLTVLNTQTVKVVTPPSITAYTQYEGRVDPYAGATVAILRLEYGNTTGAEDVYVGLVQLTDQQKPFNMSTRAVLPTAINLLVPGVLQNGSMEQPSLTGDLPEGFTASGVWTYDAGAGTADGNYSVTLGGTTATHTLETPFIFWTYPIWSTLNYGLRVRWHHYFVNAIGPTFAVRALFYNSAFTQIGSATKIKQNDATTDYVVVTNPNPGLGEGIIPGSIVPSGTAYIKIQFQLITTTGTQLWTIDAVETMPAAMPLTAASIDFRALGGAKNTRVTAGPSLPSAPSVNDTHFYTGTGKNLWVVWNGTYWLSTPPVALGQTYGIESTIATTWSVTSTKTVYFKPFNDWATYLTRLELSYVVQGTHSTNDYWQFKLWRYRAGAGWQQLDNDAWYTDKATSNEDVNFSKTDADFNSYNPLHVAQNYVRIDLHKHGSPAQIGFSGAALYGCKILT